MKKGEKPRMVDETSPLFYKSELPILVPVV
jgi:hypothetical protein